MAAIHTKTFLLPGDLVSDLLDIRLADDRSMTRTLVNMLFWNCVSAQKFDPYRSQTVTPVADQFRT